jgi:hypothetical protein
MRGRLGKGKDVKRRSREKQEENKIRKKRRNSVQTRRIEIYEYGKVRVDKNR